MKTEALDGKMAARLSDVKIDTLGETVAQRYAEALVSKLAHGIRRVDVNTETQTNSVEAKALVDTLANTLAETEMQTLG